MDALNCNAGKKYLLDMLALLLWEEKTAHELSPFHIKFGKRLYKEILTDLKSRAAYWQETSPDRYDFGTLNMGCRDLSDLYFLEKRLELIDQKFAESE
jgi:hypothetical protein